MEFNLQGFIDVLLFEVSWMEANFFFVLVSFLLWSAFGGWFLWILWFEGLLPLFRSIGGFFELLIELLLLIFVSFPKKIYRMLTKKKE